MPLANDTSEHYEQGPQSPTAVPNEIARHHRHAHYQWRRDLAQPYALKTSREQTLVFQFITLDFCYCCQRQLRVRAELGAAARIMVLVDIVSAPEPITSRHPLIVKADTNCNCRRAVLDIFNAQILLRPPPSLSIATSYPSFDSNSVEAELPTPSHICTSVLAVVPSLPSPRLPTLANNPPPSIQPP